MPNFSLPMHGKNHKKPWHLPNCGLLYPLLSLIRAKFSISKWTVVFCTMLYVTLINIYHRPSGSKKCQNLQTHFHNQGQIWHERLDHGVLNHGKFHPHPYNYRHLSEPKNCPQNGHINYIFKFRAPVSNPLPAQSQIGHERVDPWCTMPCHISL